MERSRGKLVVAILGVTILLSMGFFIQTSAFAIDWGCISGDCTTDPSCIDGCRSPVEFKLKGLEAFIGVNFGSVRCGTTFIGRVFQYNNIAEQYVDVGYWKSVICFTDYVNIEVCGETHDVFGFNLEVFFDAGDYAGKRLVLRLKAPVEGAVNWDFKAPVCGPAIQDPACACPDNPDKIHDWDCYAGLNGDGPIAAISPLELKKSWGSSLNIKCGEIEGWLCHNWAFIPRVGGILRICPNR